MDDLYDVARQVTDEVMGAGTYAEVNKGNPDPRVQAAIQRVGVHETHCCPFHGCKYGDEDCPVESGKASPRYSMNNGCEVCEGILERWRLFSDKELWNIEAGLLWGLRTGEQLDPEQPELRISDHYAHSLISEITVERDMRKRERAEKKTP